MKLSGLLLPIDSGAKLANRTSALAAKQWRPEDYMVCAAEGVESDQTRSDTSSQRASQPLAAGWKTS